MESVLADARAHSEHGFGLPHFVEEELRRFLRCGVLAHGFARLRCATCGHGMLLPFSCKRRAVCPSCTGRRAADCAIHLVDEVLPQTPVRQWVLTFPRHIRFALARDSRLATKVIAIWLRALEGFHRRCARGAGFPVTRMGAITFVQRFGSALNLNVHLHTVVPDGTFAVEGEPSFVALPSPTTKEIEALLLRVVSRVRRCVAQSIDPHSDVPLESLDEIGAASAGETPRAPFERRAGRYEAFFEGFSLHCGVRLHANDREGIERLCRYGARGPLTLGRLSRDADDVYRYRMKRAVRGRCELVMTGKELVRKLAVLVPPPRVHLVRFHGVFAPNAKHRAQVVPRRGKSEPGQTPAQSPTGQPMRRDGTSRIDWASLLRRVFKIDVLTCGRCGGRIRVIAVIEEQPAIEKILRHLGLPHVPLPTLPTLPARGQRDFTFEAA